MTKDEFYNLKIGDLVIYLKPYSNPGKRQTSIVMEVCNEKETSKHVSEAFPRPYYRVYAKCPKEFVYFLITETTMNSWNKV